MGGGSSMEFPQGGALTLHVEVLNLMRKLPQLFKCSLKIFWFK